MSKRGQVTEVVLMSAPSKQFLHDPSAMPIKGQEKALVWLSEICQGPLNPKREKIVGAKGEVNLVLYNRIYALVSTTPEQHRTPQEDQFMAWHDAWCSKYDKYGSTHDAMVKGFLDHQKGDKQAARG